MEIKIKPRTKIIEPQHLLHTRGVGQQGFDRKTFDIKIIRI